MNVVINRRFLPFSRMPKSLLRTLENPKSRSAFRTSSGFNGLLSLLSDMEGALKDPPSDIWSSLGHSHIMELVLHTLQAIAAALSWDPVNRDFFQKNGLFEKMAEDLGTLGCFSVQMGRQTNVRPDKTRTFAEFSNAATSSSEFFPTWLKSCIRILDFLDHMAKGTPFHLKSYLTERKPEEDELPAFIQEVTENQQELAENSFQQLDNTKTAASQWPDTQHRYVFDIFNIGSLNHSLRCFPFLLCFRRSCRQLPLMVFIFEEMAKLPVRVFFGAIYMLPFCLFSCTQCNLQNN